MKFSIVIPVAPERDAKVISSLKHLNYDKNDFHVVVVKGKNPSENRNKGIEKSKGEIVVFLDDDAIVDINLLKNAKDFFNMYPFIDVVGGPQLTPVDERGFAKISGYAFSSVFGAWKISNRYAGKKLILDADETMLTSANMFCRKKVFDKIRFNPLLYPGEDPDFISRAREKGFKVAYSPNLIIYHKRRQSLGELSRQIYNYGITRPKKETFRESLKMPFFLVPSLFLIYLLFLFLFLASNFTITGSIIGIGRAKSLNFLLFLPLSLYLLLCLLFSLTNSIKNRDILAFFVLPAVYLTIHLSYGFGFLKATLENMFERRSQANLEELS